MKALLTTLLFLLPALAHAELSVPHFFSDHMILQRETEAAIWGRADAGAAVDLTFGEVTATATADESGKWSATIPTGPARATGTTLTLSSGGKTITIEDVLVGEVWFASGQSNMFFPMDRVPAYESVIAESDFPGLRMFNAPLVATRDPQDDIEGAWTSASPETVPGYSAVAFFFARKLHEELGIPVGVIKSAWGGKPVETFTSREALLTLPGTKEKVEALLKADELYVHETAMTGYEARLADWTAKVKEMRSLPEAKRKPLPRRPAPPKAPLETEGQPGVLFNSMIHPFTGYTMRGAIWYQGEGNAKAGAVPYDETLPLLIRDWRSRWQDDFSFYFVQLANFRAPTTEPGDNDPWPLLQDRMRRILESTPKTGMAIINDIGEADDIHPKNKHDVGERLARWALAKDYGRDLVHSGPLFASHEVKGGSIEVTFSSVGEGLKSRDGGALKRFEIAGDDKVWHWADAKITGSDTVSLSHPDLPAPVAARYAWAANPEGANLVNSEGLPASVFRTDDWDDVHPDTAAVDAINARRELALKIREISARRDTFERNSDQWKTLHAERNRLMKEFKDTAPAEK